MSRSRSSSATPPRAIAALEGEGAIVEVRDTREIPPRCHRTADRNPGNLMAGLREAITGAHIGQVTVHNDEQAHAAIAEIIRAYPQARILLAARGCADLARLRDSVPVEERIGIARGRSWRTAGRVVAVTFEALDVAYQDSADVVVVPYGERGIPKRLRDALRDAVPLSNRYTIVKRPDPCGERVRRLREGWFGPVVHEVPHPRGPLVRYEVHFALGPAPAPGPSDPLAAKRARWSDPERNTVIAEISRAARTGDRLVLREHALDPDAIDGRAGVVVLVEGPEHGQLLRELLPDSALFTGDSPPRGVPVTDGIVTLVAADGAPITANVVVNALGGVWIPRPRGLSERADPARTVAVVDIADGNPPDAETRVRIREHENAGWDIRPSPRLGLP